MVLFAHFQNESCDDLDAIIKGLNGYKRANNFYPVDQNKCNGKDYWFDDNSICIEVRHRNNNPDLVTIIMEFNSSSCDASLDLFKTHVHTFQSNGLTAVTDKELFSDSENYDLSIYWDRIHAYIDSCRPRIPLYNDSFTSLIDSRTGEIAFGMPPKNETFEINIDIGIEYRIVQDISSLNDLNKLQTQHFTFLQSLAKFIQYVDISKTTGGKPDLKAAVHLDEVMELSYDLLARPGDHLVFTKFISNVIEMDDIDKESLYHTLSFVHSSVILLRSELREASPNVQQVLTDLQRYGRTVAIVGRIKQVNDRYPHLERVQVGRIMDSKYSESGLLRTLADIEEALQQSSNNPNVDSDLERISSLMLHYGNFNAYLRSTTGTNAKAIVKTLKKKGFNIVIFTSDEGSNNTFAREETSLELWQENFHILIDDFRKGTYNVFFMRYTEDNKEVMNNQLKKKVLSLSPQNARAEEKGASYILNKIKGMLYHCRVKQAEKVEKGKKVDAPLIELEERLENLEIQLEFGGRPTGGKLYSRQWHRIFEDFARKDFMLCCAALGGDKEELTFRAIYNPTYTYLTHFIEGIDSQLGFSILKAGMVAERRVLLSISPYEANPAIRTALGQTETYRYVMDAMVKTAYDANAEYLLIDDIDLKVRDESGNVIRMKDGVAKKKGDIEYGQAEDIVIKYKNSEPCAPRSFRRYIEKASNKYESITHEDIEFEQIEGDNELVEEQFGVGKYHYSIQSVKVLFDSHVDYTHLSADQTKMIFDDGYHQQNGTRTVFKIDVTKYIEERKIEGIYLLSK